MINENCEKMNEVMNIVGRIYDNIKKDIKQYPCYTNRASGLGYAVPSLGGCERRGVYERTHWQHKEPVDPRLQLIFNEGHIQEREVLKTLADAGIDIIEQQVSFSWPEYEISGHIDGTYIYNDTAIPVEIKSMSPNIFSTIRTYEDFNKKPWTRSYKAQINLYMLFKNINRALYILKNKSTGEIKTLVIELDYELSESCLKTAELINKHVKAGTLPEKTTDIEKCKNCPFKLICCPDIDFGVPLTINDDPDFQRRVEIYYENKDFSLVLKKEYEVIRDRCKGTALKSEKKELNQLVGNYHLTGKFDARNAFRLKIKMIDESEE